MKDKEYVDSPEKFVVSVLETISQKDPQLTRQIQRELIEHWESIKELEKMSLSFLKIIHSIIIAAFENKAMNLRNEQDWPGLIAHCEHWFEVEPNKVLALYNIAFAHKEMCLFREAIHAYQEVIDRNPEHSLAWLDLGEIYRLTGRHGEAVEAYLKVLQIRPDDALSWEFLNIIYKEQGQIEEAKKARQKAKHYGYDEVAGSYNQAVVWALKGNLPAAYNAVLEIKKCDLHRANKLMQYILSLDG
jgi:tetratricopeptide (TPR) repeat protein